MMEEYIDYILVGCVLLVNVLNAIITTLKNFKTSRNIKEIGKDVVCLKCRLPDYQEKSKVSGTTFDDKKTEFIYDEVEKNVVPSGKKINLQDLINSSADCALDKMLEKFNLDPITLQQRNETNVTLSDEIADFTTNVMDDLDVASRYMDKMSQIKRSYGFDDKMPISEVMPKLKELQKAYNAKLEQLKKGVNVDGQTPQSKPEEK